MIAELVQGSGFAGLGRYLAKGKNGSQEERVGFVVAQHMPTTNHKLAARLMRSTAEHLCKRSCKKPVLHWHVNYAEQDTPSDENMKADALRFLKDMGLEDNQAIIYSHTDHEPRRRHFHIMVNRISMEGERWSDSHWKRRADKIVRQIEIDGGYRQLDTPLSRQREQGINGGDNWPKGRRNTRAENEIAARHKTQALQHWDKDQRDQYKELLQPCFANAHTWTKIASGLSAHGLRFERKGQGIIITDGTGYLKASDLGRMPLPGHEKAVRVSLKALEAQYGQSFDDWFDNQSGSNSGLVRKLQASTSQTSPPGTRKPQRKHTPDHKKSRQTGQQRAGGDQSSASPQQNPPDPVKTKPQHKRQRQTSVLKDHSASNVEKADFARPNPPTAPAAPTKKRRRVQHSPEDRDLRLPGMDDAYPSIAMDKKDVEALRGRLGTAFTLASGWSDLASIAVSQGMRLSSGSVFCNDECHVRLVQLGGSAFRYRRLVERFGESYETWRKRTQVFASHEKTVKSSKQEQGSRSHDHEDDQDLDHD